MKTLNFFIRCLKMSYSADMMFRVEFFVRMTALLLFDLVLPVITLLIYMNSNGFQGWNFYQILLFQGIFIFVNGIDRFFFRRVNWYLSSSIRNGNFDRYLLQPINTLIYISFTNLAPEHFAHMTVGIGLIIFSLIKLSIGLSLGNLLLFLIFILISLLFLFSFQVVQYAFLLKTVTQGRMGELSITLKRYGQYPADIYTDFLATMMRYIIPITIIAYVPVKILLEGFEFRFLFTVLAVIIIFILSLFFWYDGLKKYSSAGG